MNSLEKDLKKYQSPEDFANVIGTNPQRMVQLFRKDRIVGAFKYRGRILIPKDAEILPGTKTMQGGPVRRYVDDWNVRHGRVPQAVEREKEDWEREQEEDELFM